MRIGDRNERIMFGVIVAGKTFLELIVAERQGSLSFAKLFAPDRGRHEAGDFAVPTARRIFSGICRARIF
jgi:hypothetical protein